MVYQLVAHFVELCIVYTKKGRGAAQRYGQGLLPTQVCAMCGAPAKGAPFEGPRLVTLEGSGLAWSRCLVLDKGDKGDDTPESAVPSYGITLQCVSCTEAHAATRTPTRAGLIYNCSLGGTSACRCREVMIAGEK